MYLFVEYVYVRVHALEESVVGFHRIGEMVNRSAIHELLGSDIINKREMGKDEKNKGNEGLTSGTTFVLRQASQHLEV